MIVNIKGIEEITPQKMVMNQIAFYCATAGAENQVKAMLGLQEKEWIHDTVYADVKVRGKKGRNIAELQFNYDLGCELEILRYIDGPHWMTHIMSSTPFLAHIGIHLPDGANWPLIADWQLVQEAETYKHTAVHLTVGYAAGRKYSYRIYEVNSHTFIKYIKRRNP